MKSNETKKTYDSAKLTDYGTVEQMTQTTTNPNSNDGNPACS